MNGKEIKNCTKLLFRASVPKGTPAGEFAAEIENVYVCFTFKSKNNERTTRHKIQNA